MEKVIYTDCDGVLLDWETAFHAWMELRGHELQIPGEYKMGKAYGIRNAESLIREFNASAWMGNLEPFRDARSGVARLIEAGYKLHIISSLSEDVFAQTLRIQNLEALFGAKTFCGHVYLDTGADKDHVLETLPSGAWWLEDKVENAEIGYKMGLNSIIVAHPHNLYGNPDIPRYEKFNDITDHILRIDRLRTL